MKTLVALALVLAALVAAAVLYRSGDGEAQLHQRVAAEAGRDRGQALTPDAVLAIRPVDAKPAARARRALPVSPLMEEFLKVRPYTALYQRIAAKPEPTAEELYIKAQILSQCVATKEQKARNEGRSGPRWTREGDEARAQFIASLPPNASNREKRIAAFEKTRVDPCGGMPEIELSDKDIGAMIRAAAAGGDPKARVALLERKFFDGFVGPDGKPRRDRVLPPAPDGAKST